MFESATVRKIWRWGSLAILILTIGVFYTALAKPDNLTHVYFLDVGQGDAIFLKTAEQFRILIDGGPDANLMNSLDRLVPPWDRHLDLVVLTHPHADHVSGLIEAVKRYSIDEFLFNGMAYESMTYTTLLQMVGDKQIKMATADVSHDYMFGRATFSTIYPSADDQPFNDLNDSSVVNVFNYGNFRLLLTGDISTAVENDLIARGLLSDVDVLKVAHHGSRTSTSQNFLRAVTPAVGVISAGHDNKFGHPHAETLERLQQAGVQVYRTDENGTVEVVTDGERYIIQTQTTPE